MKRFFVSFFFVFVTMVTGFAQTDLQVIAEVNLTKKEPITIGQLKDFVKRIEKADGKKTPAQRKDILDGLINQKLLLQFAQKQGIKVADSQINERINNVLSQMVGRPITEAEFSNLLRKEKGMSFDDYMKNQSGMTVNEYKEFLRENLIIQNCIYQNNKKTIDAAVPTDPEIKKAFANNKHNFVRPSAASLFLVVVQKEGKTAKEKALIEKLHARLKAAPNQTDSVLKEAQSKKAGFFAASMYVYNTEQSAAQMGITLEQLSEVFDSPVNTVSNVVEMADNFQFFVIKAKSEAKLLELNDKVDPSQDMTVYQLVKGQLTMQKQQVALEEATRNLVNELKVSKNYKLVKSDSELLKLLAW
ncbi:MAG: hypothetical protein CR988_00670 [Treponema sp.]|nr:MAG: hypothetical protein CR988_00670 [Treponema sp.]